MTLKPTWTEDQNKLQLPINTLELIILDENLAFLRMTAWCNVLTPKPIMQRAVSLKCTENSSHLFFYLLHLSVTKPLWVWVQGQMEKNSAKPEWRSGNKEENRLCFVDFYNWEDVPEKYKSESFKKHWVLSLMHLLLFLCILGNAFYSINSNMQYIVNTYHYFSAIQESIL